MAGWDDIRYFKPSEFDSQDEPGSGKRMNFTFVRKLDQIRHEVGRPLKVNSGVRSVKENKAAGGKANSAHLDKPNKRRAADISCRESRKRMQIMVAAVRVGIRRIGVAKTFIHLDDDPKLPREVLWLYD